MRCQKSAKTTMWYSSILIGGMEHACNWKIFTGGDTCSCKHFGGAKSTLEGLKGLFLCVNLQDSDSAGG